MKNVSDKLNSEKLIAGQIFAGRYHVLSLLGKGGIGTVYKVYDDLLNEHVALKVLNSFRLMDSGTRQRFLLETKIARSLSHENVVRIFDINIIGEVLYISMEYLEGHDLKFLIRSGKTKDHTTRMDIVRQILAGLEYVHRNKIIHRDIKPHNIMVLPDGRVKILDFGLARGQQHEGMTTEGLIVGTPEYMSPEQALSRSVDIRSDIYSLGIVLFELFTSTTPFSSRSNPLEILTAHATEPPPDPADLIPDFDPALRTIILKCLQKEPEKRYQSAREILEELPKIEREILPISYSATIVPTEYAEDESVIVFDSSISRQKVDDSISEALTSDILIVDDDALVLEMIHDQVSLVSHSVSAVSSTAVALEMIKTKEFGVIISDYDIDEMNGLELLELVGQISPQTQRMLLTGKPSFQLAMDAINRNLVDRFLVKPYKIQEFLDSITQLLKNFVSAKSIRTGVARLRILAVFDSRRTQRIIRQALIEDHTVIVVDDAPEAFSELEKQQYHVIVSSVELTTMSGTAMLEEAHNRGGEPLVKIVCDWQENIARLDSNEGYKTIPLEKDCRLLKKNLDQILRPSPDSMI